MYIDIKSRRLGPAETLFTFQSIIDIDMTHMAMQTFIATQRLGKHLPAATNTHATTEEVSFLCNVEVNTPL
jgi:hypothetical protein